tara:strand:- start:53 stop:346 length:294 start_codon:yes stop_codon:yes gene_type:complete
MSYKAVGLFALISMIVIASGIVGECSAQFGDRDPEVILVPVELERDTDSTPEPDSNNDSDVLHDAGPDIDSGSEYDTAVDKFFEECDKTGCYVVPSC